VAVAERQYAHALEVAGPDSPQRSRLLVRWAKAAIQLGRVEEAVKPLEDAIDCFQAEGDVRAAAVARMALATALPEDGGARWLELADEAVASLEAQGPSRELVAVLTEWLRLTLELGDYRAQLDRRPAGPSTFHSSSVCRSTLGSSCFAAARGATWVSQAVMKT